MTTTTKVFSIPLIGPVKVSWTTRPVFPISSDEITEHIVSMYWQGADTLIRLDPVLPSVKYAPDLLQGQPILVSDSDSYIVKMIEPFILPPAQISSPFEGMIGYSNTGFCGYRFLVEKESEN